MDLVLDFRAMGPQASWGGPRLLCAGDGYAFLGEMAANMTRPELRALRAGNPAHRRTPGLEVGFAYAEPGDYRDGVIVDTLRSSDSRSTDFKLGSGTHLHVVRRLPLSGQPGHVFILPVGTATFVASLTIGTKVTFRHAFSGRGRGRTCSDAFPYHGGRGEPPAPARRYDDYDLETDDELDPIYGGGW